MVLGAVLCYLSRTVTIPARQSGERRPRLSAMGLALTLMSPTFRENEQLQSTFSGRAINPFIHSTNIY